MAEESKKENNTTKVKGSKNKTIKELRHDKFYYSFLTIVLIFCLIQIGFSAILNISKVVSHKTKIMALKRVLHDAENHNQDLKKEIQSFSSAPNLEGIARNNLKMAGEDEVLIIINNTKQENKKKTKKDAE